MAASLALGIAGKLMDRLGNVALEGICLAWGVQKELEKLKDTVAAIKAVLLDAEEQQGRNREVSLWLKKFKGACYEVEDLVDAFEIQELRRQVLQRQSTGTGRKVRYFFSGSNPLAFRFRMGYKLKKANEMLNEIAANKSKFHLTEKHEIKNGMHGEREISSFVRRNRMSHHVIGRDGDRDKIVNEFLMQHPDPTNGVDIPVLPIVGIGGVGKTTLAQLVFNDEKVRLNFDLRIWVCVSEEFDIKKLMIKMIKSATGVKFNDMSKEQLKKELQNCLNSKQFLLVLDNVCNKDKKKWEELTNLLGGGAVGSKIIVTTRSNQVATIIGTIPGYDLENLSYENSWLLFLKLALKEDEEKQYPNLMRIGEEIVQKCKGVALAVNTVASLLCSTRVENDWRLIRDSELWKSNDILPALKLSYDHFPWELKQCFSYCSIFPKDFEIDDVLLVSFWMAHGLLQSSNRNEELEDVGNRYTQELCSRFFFQEVEDSVGFSKFKMHDLVHDLALSVAENEVNIPHIRFDDFLKEHAFELPIDTGRLRTFLASEREEASSDSLIATYISKARQLRVLDLSDTSIEQLPNSIHYLKHLKYFSIAGNGNIKKLPNSICNLQSLQTLNFDTCKGIEELPKDIRYLISLRTLLVTTKQANLHENGIGCLTSLRFLSLSECENLEKLFEDLQSLTALRTLLINKCKSLISLPQGLKNLIALETLVIHDCEKLDLSATFKELEFGGKEHGIGRLRNFWIGRLPKVESLPQWIVVGSIKTLQHLVIYELENLLMLPSWFQNLISLQILKIGNCPKLSSLPQGMQHLTALKQLFIFGCPTLSQRCLKETGEDWPNIAHVPNISLFDFGLSTSDDEYNI